MLATKLESYNKVDKQTRYKQIQDELEKYPSGLTARELATNLGYVERNSTSPRLTELESLGKIKINGTRYDKITKRNVAVYVLKEKQIENKTMTVTKCQYCRHGLAEEGDVKFKKGFFCTKTRVKVTSAIHKKIQWCLFFEERR